MVQISQTEDEIKIVIELNRLVTRKPDVVVLPFYLKFNNPPIFFERHLTHEIDPISSFCSIFKTEARIVLFKKEKGVWPELFQKFSNEELIKKRLEIADIIVERNKERDQKALERFESKRRAEIEKELKRETAMRERVKQFQEQACRDALMVGVRKETHEKPRPETRGATTSPNPNPIPQGQHSSGRIGTPSLRQALPLVRGKGKINIAFSNSHKLNTPKRESQEGVTFPFTIKDNYPNPDDIKETPNQ